MWKGQSRSLVHSQICSPNIWEDGYKNQRKEEEGKWGTDVGGAHLIRNILNVSKDSFNLKVETFAKLFVSSRQKS